VAWIASAALFLILPLSLVILRGLRGLDDLPTEVWGGLGRSVLVALGATATSLLLGLSLALRGGAVARSVGALPLAASPLVIGTGLLLILRPLVPLDGAALPVAAAVDGIAALPFALQVLTGPLAEVEARHGRLASALGLTGWLRLRIVVLPLLRPALGFAAGLAAALSAGNLGVIALFANEGEATLPLLMARLMGAYRMEAAAGVGLLILALALLLFWLFDRAGRHAAA
jgi:thiamine transport system permease protein